MRRCYMYVRLSYSAISRSKYTNNLQGRLTFSIHRHTKSSETQSSVAQSSVVIHCWGNHETQLQHPNVNTASTSDTSWNFDVHCGGTLNNNMKWERTKSCFSYKHAFLQVLVPSWAQQDERHDTIVFEIRFLEVTLLLCSIAIHHTTSICG